MAKKTPARKRKRKETITEWNFGQPLDFPRKKDPLNIGQLAHDLVKTTIVEPVAGKKRLRKRPRQKA
jgi:hypothetical protein